jgi:hypothetical protein
MNARVVIDSNMLQSPTLEAFLKASPQHQAVITDYAWMEAYKLNPLSSIQERLQILERFPDQTVVLKGTKDVGALDARAPAIANRMIRTDGTFHETVEGLKALRTGDPKVILGILLHGKAAAEQLEKNLLAAADTLAAFSEMQEIFTPVERRIIRTGASYTPDIGRKIFRAAQLLAMNFFDAHPFNPRRPTRNSLVNTFLYRFALAAVLYLMGWIRVGSPQSRKHERIRNDLVDLNFATYGTFFNGLMSQDRLALDVHEEIRIVLRIFGARVPPQYAAPPTQ